MSSEEDVRTRYHALPPSFPLSFECVAPRRLGLHLNVELVQIYAWQFCQRWEDGSFGWLLWLGFGIVRGF